MEILESVTLGVHQYEKEPDDNEVFSTKLNGLTKNALRVSSTNKSKIRIFNNRLQSDITKDMMIGDHALSFYSNVLSKTHISKAMQ